MKHNITIPLILYFRCEECLSYFTTGAPIATLNEGTEVPMKKKHHSKQKLVVVAQPRPARFRRNVPVTFTKPEQQVAQQESGQDRQAS